MFRKILVGLEGSEASWCAFRRAVSLAQEHVTELWALSVEEHLPRYAATMDEVQEEQAYEDSYFEGIHNRARERAETAGVDLHCKKAVGHAAQQILECAQSGLPWSWRSASPAATPSR